MSKETTAAICGHGQLARSCDVCELEAERDRLAAENAALRGEMPDAETLERAATTIEGGGYHFLARELSDAAAAIRALSAPAPAAEAYRDRLALEVAALRGAMPLAHTYDAKTFEGLDAIEARAKRVIADTDAASYRNDCGHQDRRRFLAGDILRLVRLVRALSAPAPAAEAEAGTGGEWSREAPTEAGRYWVVWTYEDIVTGEVITEPSTVVMRDDGGWLRAHWPGWGYDGETILLYGPSIQSPAPPDGWREALAALDTPQEADHAR